MNYNEYLNHKKVVHDGCNKYLGDSKYRSMLKGRLKMIIIIFILILIIYYDHDYLGLIAIYSFYLDWK